MSKLSRIPLLAAMLLAVSASANTVSGGFSFFLGIPTDGPKLDLGSGSPDVRWDGSAILPVGEARLLHLGSSPTSGCPWSALACLIDQAANATTDPIPFSKISPGDAIVVVTNGGSTSQIGVNKSGTILNFNYTTYLGSAPGVPFIDQILNNSSLVYSAYPTFPNSGIAPSSLFLITGDYMADPGDPVLQSSAGAGLPLTLNGSSISVTVNGQTVHPALYYTSPHQLAAVLPASTPLGSGTVTVTYRGHVTQSNPIQVVSSAVGINSYNDYFGVVTDAATGGLISYTNSASPGQVVTLWATGLGADPADSDTTLTSTPHAVKTPLQIYVGSQQAAILYQGASPYPGVNQINFAIPTSAPTGCWIPVAAVTEGMIASNVIQIPVNKQGGACIDAGYGMNGSKLALASTAQGFRVGILNVIQYFYQGPGGVQTIGLTAISTLQKYTGSYSWPWVSPAGCLVYHVPNGVPAPVPRLDGGPITVSGPGGSAVLPAPPSAAVGDFTGAISAGDIYTFNGQGGSDVGPVSATLKFAGPLMTWTNPADAASIDRSKGLRVTWTGGAPGSFVNILGGTGSSFFPNFFCTAPAEAGEFTVPAYVLSNFSTAPVTTTVQYTFYSPLLVSGLDTAVASGTIYLGTVTSAVK